MSKEVINVGGEEKVVREDTAKAFRGTNWALISIAIFIIIAAVMFFFFFIKKGTNSEPVQSPTQIEQKRQ